MEQGGVNPMILVHVPVVVRAGVITPELLEKVKLVLQDKAGRVVEVQLMNTTEGFIEDALLERKEVSRVENPSPGVLDVTELGYFFEGRKVRQDVVATVDPLKAQALAGKIG